MSSDRYITSSVGAGKQRRARRILGHEGRAVIVAMDHAGFQGHGPPNADGLPAIMAGRPDGVLVNWHLARSSVDLLADSGLLLRVDGGTSDLGERKPGDVSGLLHRAEDALTLGADAVAVMAYPGAQDEHVSLGRLATLCTECDRLGLPVMAEVVPGGFGGAVPWSTENVARGARIAAELGADLIKTMSPPQHEDLRSIVAGCPVPIVILGGARMDSDDDVVDHARSAIAAGAAGVAFGRNVWGSSEPAKLIKRLREVVHDVIS